MHLADCSDLTNMSSESKNIESADKVLDATVTQDVPEIDRQGAVSDYDLTNDPHRGLRMRHVQLLAISGAVGAGLFVSIGGPLTSAGPLGLLIGVLIWSFVIWCGSNSLVEMTTLLPVDGGFITFIARFWDDCASRAIGWNVSAPSRSREKADSQYCIAQASLVCFELTAMNVLVSYWTTSLHFRRHRRICRHAVVLCQSVWRGRILAQYYQSIIDAWSDRLHLRLDVGR
jgi:amino acid transporter